MSASALSAANRGDGFQPPLETGWFGKIPAVGDFINRRLPNSFITPWDNWLQDGMAQSQQALGERWDELYLTFPVWRFLLPAQLAGPQAWAGVLMPSVDRVGRYFPLTIAAPIESPLASWSLTALEAALSPLEAAGMEALDGETSDAFDTRTRDLDVRTPCAKPGRVSLLESLEDPSAQASWPMAQGLTAALADEAGQQVLALLGNRVLWWLPGSSQSGGTIRVLPWPLPDTAFATLILHD